MGPLGSIPQPKVCSWQSSYIYSQYYTRHTGLLMTVSLHICSLPHSTHGSFTSHSPIFRLLEFHPRRFIPFKSTLKSFQSHTGDRFFCLYFWVWGLGWLLGIEPRYFPELHLHTLTSVWVHWITSLMARLAPSPLPTTHFSPMFTLQSLRLILVNSSICIFKLLISISSVRTLEIQSHTEVLSFRASASEFEGSRVQITTKLKTP